MSAPGPRVSVVVPARDAAATIERTIAGVAAQELEGEFELIVVDDGSRDATASLAEGAGDRAIVLRQDRRGAAQARNRGAAAARADLLAFTDADCVPAAGWLAAGVAALEASDIVQGRVEPDPAAPLGPFDRSLWIEAASGLFETANLFVAKETFDRVGGFVDWVDTGATKLIAEDVWFGWRAVRAGARTAFAPDAIVHHAVFPRGMRDYALERARLRWFPVIARRVPELRSRFFLGAFLTTRSAAFDAGLLALAAAAARRSALPLAAAAPYAWINAREALRWGGRSAPKVAMGRAIADLVGFGALVAGSVRARSLLL